MGSRTGPIPGGEQREEASQERIERRGHPRREWQEWGWSGKWEATLERTVWGHHKELNNTQKLDLEGVP